MDLHRIIAELLDQNPDACFFENLDSALIGLGRIGTGEVIAVYSQKGIYDKLTKDGFDDNEIEAYFAQLSNQLAGANTPLIIYDVME